MTDTATKPTVMNDTMIRPARGALAGVAAVAMSFGLSELVAAILGVPSLIQGIADRVVDSVSPGLKEFAISVFGTNDKVALLVGIAVVALGLGALLGVLSRRRDQPIVIAIIVLAVVAAFATSRSAASGQLAPWLLALAAMAAGVFTFRWLMKERGPAPSGRREMLKATSATGLGLILAGSGRLLGAAGTEAATGRDTVAVGGGTATTLGPLPVGTSFDIPELTPIVVPNEDFYRIDTAIAIPRVAVDTWKLSFIGMVDNPYEITFDELMERRDGRALRHPLVRLQRGRWRPRRQCPLVGGAVCRRSDRTSPAAGGGRTTSRTSRRWFHRWLPDRSRL